MVSQFQFSRILTNSSNFNSLPLPFHSVTQPGIDIVPLALRSKGMGTLVSCHKKLINFKNVFSSFLSTVLRELFMKNNEETLKY